MFLDELKEAYKKTFTEPRLSGKLLPKDFQDEMFSKIDASTTLDEFCNAINQDERHILMRILEWESLPPFVEEEPEEEKEIPRNLDEAIELFKKHADPEGLKKWASEREGYAGASIHHGSGRALRNDWGLWGVGEEKSEIYKWFNTIGIAMGDDLSGIIFTSLHRHLNNKPINLQEQVKVYWKHWREYKASEYLPPNIPGCSQEYLDLYNKAVEAGEI